MDGNTSERKKESNEAIEISWNTCKSIVWTPSPCVQMSLYRHQQPKNPRWTKLVSANRPICEGESQPQDADAKIPSDQQKGLRVLTVSSLGLKIADTSLDYASKQTHNHAWIHALIICSERNSDMVPLLIKVGLKEVEIWKTQYRYNNSINSSSAEATKSLRNIVKDAN